MGVSGGKGGCNKAEELGGVAHLGHRTGVVLRRGHRGSSGGKS